ncbi:MAG TPA: cbb3-type cytochrome c oxidase subunit II [Terracidiphilus sp.]|nr:cbb3-type cytochrome c oxidase subunit II [Terracidiphilus sp.]
MRPNSTSATEWRGVFLVAFTYVYFLIFAQFAFLSRLAQQGIGGAHLKAVMGAMAAGGVLLSLLAPRVRWCASPVTRLRAGFAVCGLAALATLAPLGTATAMAVALAVGAGLGLVTVTLVTHLRRWTGEHGALWKVGLGTGTGYLLCNVPQLFAASPQAQAASAVLVCGAAIWLAGGGQLRPISLPSAATPRPLAFPFVVACFAGLVWLDSAAFFIIQHTPQLKAGTWQGTAHLWANGVLHFVAALASVWLLRRRGLYAVLAAAFLVLAGACLLLLDPAHTLQASVLYPVGVSLYSVALVAYPSLLSPAATAEARGRQAGWIYAIAGWGGSALGIGMGQNLGHVPPAFLAGAGAVVLLPGAIFVIQQRTREALATLAILGLAYGVYRLQGPPRSAAPQTAVERGRQVYIAEGCISCHSQYVRPNTDDVLMWGPAESVDAVRHEQPPLIGNRRQGPDLAEVGARRSAFWLKMHFFNPAQVSGASIMPPYGFLFQDGRGQDLVAYLESLRGPGVPAHLAAETQWSPSPQAEGEASVGQGHVLCTRYCATCHDADGATRVRWKASFAHQPPDLRSGPFRLPLSVDLEQRQLRLAQVAKFGIPGTDMPGHEYLSDREIASLSLWLAQNIAQSAPSGVKRMQTGDK